jgi:hypothetical protein
MVTKDAPKSGTLLDPSMLMTSLSPVKSLSTTPLELRLLPTTTDSISTMDRLMIKASITVSADCAEFLDKSMKVISLKAANTDGAEKSSSILSTTVNSRWTRNSMIQISSGAPVHLIHTSTNLFLELKTK